LVVALTHAAPALTLYETARSTSAAGCAAEVALLAAEK